MVIRNNTICSTLHPIVSFVYIASILILSMLLNHPTFTAVSFCTSVCCNVFFYGWRKTGKSILFLLPLLLLVAGLNLFTNHRGMHLLFQIGHTPYTLESLLYGCTNGMMLGSVLLWFRCYNALISNEKFLYLFGKTFPTTALLLSMILKLFPETKYKIRSIRYVQKDNGEEKKLKKLLRQISCLLEWSMEDSIETADAMKARAYGTKKRTSYASYSFGCGDAVMLGLYIMILMLLLFQAIRGELQFSFFPAVSFERVFGFQQLLTSIFYSIYLLSPIWLEGMDAVRQYIRARKAKKNR